MAGFPNLFTITGPQSPSVLSNMPVSIEQHVEWITECIAYMRRNKLATIEATAQAQDAWVAHVTEVVNATRMPGANSWYMERTSPASRAASSLTTGRQASAATASGAPKSPRTATRVLCSRAKIKAGRWIQARANKWRPLTWEPCPAARLSARQRPISDQHRGRQVILSPLAKREI